MKWRTAAQQKFCFPRGIPEGEGKIFGDGGCGRKSGTVRGNQDEKRFDGIRGTHLEIWKKKTMTPGERKNAAGPKGQGWHQGNCAMAQAGEKGKRVDDKNFWVV
ncbi:MAG: hypothetical protein AB7S78_14220 [Candidatus Omnitrophota bacterium]